MEFMLSAYITAFLLGLFSTVHCLAMCGSVIGALTLSLPQQVRESQRRLLPYVFIYNLGRIMSYAIAGAIVGVLSSPLADIGGHIILRWLSIIVMIAMGLYLAGWFPSFAKMERIGAPIWRILQPIGHKLIPVRAFSQAFWLGAVWGWLPCGLVYAALAMAITVGEPINAALVMVSFGLGTLPAVMSAGVFAGLLASLARAKPMRQLAGISIIVMALLTLLLPHQHSLTSHALEFEKVQEQR